MLYPPRHPPLPITTVAQRLELLADPLARPHGRPDVPVDDLPALALAAELRSHHAYVSASRYAAGPNHVLEAMACGLPVLHLETGALPEYCLPHGMTFGPTTFESRLTEFVDELPRLREGVLDADVGLERMIDEWEGLFERLCEGAVGRSRPIARLYFRAGYPAVRTARRVSQLGRYGIRYFRGQTG